jgi:hypothetical protein
LTGGWQSLTSDHLKGLWTKEEFDQKYRMRVLPNLPDAQHKHVHLFRTDFGKGFGVTEFGLALGASEQFLNRNILANCLSGNILNLMSHL